MLNSLSQRRSLMRDRLLAVVLALATSMPAVLSAQSPVPEEPRLEDLAWLEGEWHRQTRRGTSIERWQLLPDGGLVGESLVVPTGTTEEIELEALLLVRMGADVFYIARPRQNEFPTGFRLLSATAEEAVFENSGHDFPQRIVYRRDGPDAFVATISGPGDSGQVQEIDFRFARR